MQSFIASQLENLSQEELAQHTEVVDYAFKIRDELEFGLISRRSGAKSVQNGSIPIASNIA
jgi:hypothetical protein